MFRDRAEGADRPREGIVGGVLADAVLAGVHRRGDLGGVAAAFGVGDAGELRGPRACRARDEGAGAAAEAGVDDGGHVAGAGQVPLADRGGQDLVEVQAGEFGGAHRPPQPFRLVARFLPVSRRQGRQQQVPVALLAGGAGFGGPDRVQDGQVVGVGQRLLPGLGRGQLLAVPLQHVGQDSQRVPGAGGCCGRVGSGGRRGGVLVVAGQFGGRARARRRVGELGRQGEHVGGVGVGAAGQGDVGVLAVLGAGDHRQAGVHGAALRGVVGDRIPQFGSFVARVQEVPVGPAALPGFRVGVQGPADEQPVVGDGVDAQQVAVGQRPAGFPGLDRMVVAGADDQVPGAGRGAVGDAHGRVRAGRCRGGSGRRGCGGTVPGAARGRRPSAACRCRPR